MKNNKIICSLLCWNVLPLTRGALQSLSNEALRASKEDSLDVSLLLLDNGSTDGTRAYLEDFNVEDVECEKVFLKTNIGNSLGRNKIIENVLSKQSRYWFCVDGDVEVVPGSLTAFYNELSIKETNIISLGAHDLSGVKSKKDITLRYDKVSNLKENVTNLYTNYALFDMNAFKDGIRFCSEEPFCGPGWGFEDCELACQLFDAGYTAVHVDDLKFLHRHMSSSVAVIKTQGDDPNKLWKARKELFLTRWQNNLNPKIKAVVDWAITQGPSF